MSSKNTITAAQEDIRFINVDHRCLLPGKSEHKCDHWGCKVTAKTPQYYPGWKKFFEDRGTTRFHIHRRKLADFTNEQIERMPDAMRTDKAWLTPMPKGDGNTPELNTGWTVEAEGYWPERAIYNADEVAFIHVEYQTLRSKPDGEIKTIIASKSVDKTNYYQLLNDSVMDVKEVAIFVGKEVVNG